MRKMLSTLLLALSFANEAAENSNHVEYLSKSKTEDTVLAPKGPVSDFLINYFATAGMNWAGSALMNAFGIQSQSQQELADLGVLVNDMNTVLTDLSTIQSQLNTLLGDFNVLYQQVLTDQETQYGAYITILQNGVGTYWSDFQNNIPANATLQTIANNPASVSGLQAEFNDAALNALFNDLTDMTDTENTGFYGIMVGALNQKISAQISEINYGLGGGDVVPYINGYNESLMNLYQSTMVSVQQSYVIFSTIAYLMANTPDFSSITIPIPGVKPSNSYAINQEVIDQFYQNLIFGEAAGAVGIFNMTAASIYSDQFSNNGFALVDLENVTQILWPLPLPANVQSQCTANPSQCKIFSTTYAAKFQPMSPKTVGGMPLSYQPSGSNAKAWTSSCNLYIWQGVVPPSGITWQGATVVPTCSVNAQSGNTQCTTSLGGGGMTAWCIGGVNYLSYSIDLNQSSEAYGPWSFYYGPYANQSVNLGKLQPQTYSSSWVQSQFSVSFNQNLGFAGTGLFEGLDPHNCAYIDNVNFNNPPYLNFIVDSNPSHDSCSTSPLYNVATAKLPGGTFWSIWQYVSLDGLTTPLWIGGSITSANGQDYTYGFQVQCSPLDEFCYQPLAVSNGNGVCLGGNEVLLAANTSNSVNAFAYYGCGSSVGRAGPDSNG